MRITQLLGLLLLTGFLSGCVIWHTDAPPPEKFSNTDLLKSLIGQKSESVIRKLGLPNELLLDGDKQFMIYLAHTPRTRHFLELDYFWMSYDRRKGEGSALYCLRIQLDSDGFVVKKPQVRSITSHPKKFIPPLKNCRHAFWSQSERENLKAETIFRETWQDIEKERLTKIEADWAEKAALEKEKFAENEAKKAEKIAQELARLEQDASKGDAFAQLTLFKELLNQDINQALGWLCRSADLRNQEARSIMAKIYEYGGYIWIKKGIVQQNYKLAYVWHALSWLYDQDDLQFFADRYLTAAELSEAKNLLREWRPGQCERDLGLVSYTE